MFRVRSILVLCLAPCIMSCLHGGGGDEPEDPENPGNSDVRVLIEPASVVARHGESVTVRVDTPNATDRDLPAGFAFDLDEVRGDIDVTTAPCPAGTGTRACQDWTITPGARSVPGRYDVHVRTVGSRAGTGNGNFELHVLLPPARDNGAAVRVAASGGDFYHVLVLNDAGRVFVMGDNSIAASRVGYQRLPVPGLDFGDLNRQIFEPGFVTEFVEAPLPAGSWTSIAVSGYRSYAVREDGSAWAWGDNGAGAFGFPPGVNQPREVSGRPIPQISGVRSLLPARASVDASFALLSDGSVQYWQATYTPATPLCEEFGSEPAGVCLRPFTDVRAMAVSWDGVGYSTSNYPPFGNSAVLKSDGSVWDSGPQPGRIAGVPDPTISIAMDGDGNLVMLAADGTVWFKRPDREDILPVAGLSDVLEISARPDEADAVQDLFALRRDGTVWTWNLSDSFGSSPQPVPGLANVIALGAHYAITGDCGNGGALWRIERWPQQIPRAFRIPGFGAGAGCTPPATEELTITVSGQGRVISIPAGIDCGQSCRANLARGGSVRLLAVAEAGWSFHSWSETGCSTRPSIDRFDSDVEIMLEQALTCDAVFMPGGERRLSVRVEGGGRVTSDTPGIDCGLDCREAFPVNLSVTLTARPDLGYRFERFTGDVDCVDGILEMTGVRSCVALFTALPAPAAPTGFDASAIPINVQLRWDAVNGAVVRYSLERADASGSFQPINERISGTASSYTDGSAAPDSTYTYRLTAFNESGASPPVTTTVTTGSLPPPPVQGWMELGSALSVTNEGPQSPSIAVDANGIPTVAYVESSASIGRLFVKRFDGTDWQALGGGALNATSNTSASDPSLVLGFDGNPRVAFSQGNGQQQNIFVALFDGNAWQALGPPGVPLNQTTGSFAIRPSLAMSDRGSLAAAWIENGAVRIKAYRGEFQSWDSFGASGPASSNADRVELAFTPLQEPVVAWRETSNGMRELRAARGFALQSIGLVTGPLPSNEVRDFGLIVETLVDPLGTPLVVFGQGDVPWSIRTRRYDGTNWLQLPDALSGIQLPLQAMALHRSAINQGVAYTYQSGGTDSGLFVFRREQAGWAPASDYLFLRSSPQLSLAMAGFSSPVVAVVEHDGGTYRLRVFRYFP